MILIAGSNGHVGQEIVKKAISKGISARCFDLNPLDIPDIDTSSLDIVAGDITDPQAVSNAVKGVKAVMFVIGLQREAKGLTHEMVEPGGMKNII